MRGQKRSLPKAKTETPNGRGEGAKRTKTDEARAARSRSKTAVVKGVLKSGCSPTDRRRGSLPVASEPASAALDARPKPVVDEPSSKSCGFRRKRAKEPGEMRGGARQPSVRSATTRLPLCTHATSRNARAAKAETRERSPR
ncbi:hypothetical protein HPB47_008394 [Ixodes persulcatus]|uniref:Uncharacterized protein n=1 Tax=Ixodes persulcatus TaxID=34615 RepID=A0AC60P4X4_IXOPE|nr:hypothetical protein HPB47_008394 [Ixodes persulcatus]